LVPAPLPDHERYYITNQLIADVTALSSDLLQWPVTLIRVVDGPA